MGGRVYDPIIGRFLTTDPLVQSPFYGQSYNRYAYAWNNPLRVVDSTGFEGEGDDLGDLDGEDEDVDAMFSADNFWAASFEDDIWGPGNFQSDMSALLTTFSDASGFGGNAVDANQFGSGNDQPLQSSLLDHGRESLRLEEMHRFLDSGGYQLKGQTAGGGEPSYDQMMAGIRASHADPLFELSARVGVTKDYSAEETRAILSGAVAELNSHTYPVALAEFANNVATGTWDFKSKPTGLIDTFRIGSLVLNSGEMGNYFAGYVAQARFGLFGLENAMAEGELFNLVQHFARDPTVPTVFDPTHDQCLIVKGAADASRTYGWTLW